MLGAVNRNGRRNGSYYHSVGARYGIENENEGVADADDRYLLSHWHDVNVGGKGGRHPGRLNKWALWASAARRPQNGASE